MTTETRSSGGDSPERPQDEAGLRLPTHIVIMAATVAGLATVWTMVEIVLFVEPFALVGMPRYMRWAGAISLGLALLLFGLTWWLRRRPGLDRVVNGIQVLPHPSILRWVALASGAIMLLIGVAKDDIREQDVAQKQLAERGIDFTFDAFQNVLYLLNFGGIDLFLKAGVEPDRVFTALGRPTELNDQQPLVYVLTRRIDSSAEAEQLVDLIHDPGRDGSDQGNLDQIIEADRQATLLSFALDAATPELAIELLRRGASPFEHPADGAGGTVDPYMIDPYLPLVEGGSPVSSSLSAEARARIAEALRRAGIQPSHFVQDTYGDALDQLLNETTPLVSSAAGEGGLWSQARLWWSADASAPAAPEQGRCELDQGKLITEGCPWIEGVSQQYHGVLVERRDAAGCAIQPFALRLDHLWAYRRADPERALALLEGEMVTGELPRAREHVFLQLDRDHRLALFQRHRDGSFSQHHGQPETFATLALAGRGHDLRMLRPRAPGVAQEKAPQRRYAVPLAPWKDVTAFQIPGYLDAALYQVGYRISLREWRQLAAKVAPTDGDLCVGLHPVDSTDRAPPGTLLRAGSEALALEERALAPGEYELIVQAAGAGGRYRVEITTDEPGLVAVASLEDAPPPARDWPRERFLDKGEIAPDGQIFYRVASDAWQKVSIALTGLATDVDLAVFRADAAGRPVGEPVASSTKGETSDERVEGAILVPATYVIALQSFGGGTPYSLAINAEPSEGEVVRGGTSMEDAEDLGEIDQSLKLKAYVGPGYPTAVFGFDLAEPGQLQITLDELQADLDLELLAADGSSLDVAGEVEAAPEHLARALPGGRYFVKVRSFESSASTYQLALATTPLDPDTAATLAAAPPGPDDTPTGARDVGNLSYGPAYLEDVLSAFDRSDFVRFELSAPGSVLAELSDLTRDADLVLYDAVTMAEIAGSYGVGPADELIEAPLAAGRYLLEIQNPGDGVTPYALSLAAR